MSELEMTVEALKRCVAPEDFEQAMKNVQKSAESRTLSESGRNLCADQVVGRLLLEVGIPTAVRGYRYGLTGIRMLMEHPELADGITKALYPAIAKIHQSTPSRVERGIRHGVERAFERCDRDVLYGFFGNTVSPWSGKPTNSEFLTCMANIARERLEKEIRNKGK